MCRHSKRIPRKLKLLAFRQIVQNSSKHQGGELEFISKIHVLWKYFAHINFIIDSHYYITRRGHYTSMIHIVQGQDLFKHITEKLKCQKFRINFWCLDCNSFCSQCIDSDETDDYKYTTQIADCKYCEKN